MEPKVKVRLGAGNDSLKRKAAFLRAKKKMRKQMDRAWKDFFEKNPGMKEEDIRRRVEERMTRKQK
jgi:hypothetical protein